MLFDVPETVPPTLLACTVLVKLAEYTCAQLPFLTTVRYSQVPDVVGVSEYVAAVLVILLQVPLLTLFSQLRIVPVWPETVIVLVLLPKQMLPAVPIMLPPTLFEELVRVLVLLRGELTVFLVMGCPVRS